MFFVKHNIVRRNYLSSTVYVHKVSFLMLCHSHTHQTREGQFEEGNLINETRNDTERDDKSDSKSIMMSEKDMEISMEKKSSMTTL